MILCLAYTMPVETVQEGRACSMPPGFHGAGDDQTVLRLTYMS